MSFGPTSMLVYFRASTILKFYEKLKSKFYKQAQHRGLFNLVRGQEGFTIYLFGDKGYLLLP